MFPLKQLVPIALCFTFALTAAQATPNIIFDSDFRSDVDDAGALAILQDCQDKGLISVAGLVAGTSGRSIVAAMDSVNTYYGRPNIPIGLTPNGSAPDVDWYAPTIGNPRYFVSNQHNSTAPDSTLLYRSLLNGAANSSMTIVVVGAQSGIYKLLQSGTNYGGDGINLTGLQLIQSKVAQLVIMGGNFSDPNFVEFNISLDINAAQQVARTWPTPIVYSGYEVGVNIQSGGALTNPQINPVAEGFLIYPYDSGGSSAIGNRSSWDESAALYAAVGSSYGGNSLWTLSAAQSVDFGNDGKTIKSPLAGGNRYYLTINSTQTTNAANAMSALMTAPPANQGPRPSATVSVGEWPFTDASGSTVLDSSGNTCVATLRNLSNTAAGAGTSGSSGWTTDQRLRFDGVDDYLQTGVNLLNFGTGSFTLEAIVQYSGPISRGWTPIFGSSYSPYSASEILFVGKHDSSDALNINIGGLAGFDVPSSGFFDGASHHLAVVFDDSANQIRVYRDYTLIFTQSSVTGAFTGGSDLLVGATGHASTERWFGYFSYARACCSALPVGSFHHTHTATRYEVENLISPNYSSAAGGVHRMIGPDASLSNSDGDLLESNNVGDYLTYLLPNIAAGSYNVKVGIKKYSARGQFQLKAGRADNYDGTASNVGGVVDEYASGIVYTEVDLGTWIPGSTSDKWFRFNVVGKNASSGGTSFNYSLALDYITLTPL